MPFSDPIVAGEVLVRAAIQSPDYETGVSGWQVSADGSIEAADLMIRGPDGRYIRGYIEPSNSLPVLDFRPPDPVTAGWDVSAGSIYEYSDGTGFELLGISSPQTFQPGPTGGEAKIELRSGKASVPQTMIRITCDVLYLYAKLWNPDAGNYYLPAQRGVVLATASGAPSAQIPVDFPLPFPNNNVSVFVNINSGAGSTARCWVRALNPNANGFTLFIESTAIGTNLAWSGVGVGWLAVTNP